MKRRRVSGGGVVVVSKKAKISKQLKVVEVVSTGGTQGGISLFTAPYPSTGKGFVWNVDVANTTDSGPSAIDWAVVLVKEGEVPDAFSNTGTWYAPESQVIVWGRGQVTATSLPSGPSIKHWEGKTKVGRNLQDGDQIFFIFLTDTACSVTAMIQWINSV